MTPDGENPADVAAVEASIEAARQAELDAAQRRAKAIADVQAVIDADPALVALDPAAHIQSTARAVLVLMGSRQEKP